MPLIDQCDAEALGWLKSIRVVGLWNQEEAKREILSSWCHNRNRRLRYLKIEAPAITVEDLHRQHEITFGSEGDPWQQYRVDTGYSYESDGEV